MRVSIEESPIVKRKILQKKYPGQKMKKIGTVLKRTIFNNESSERSSSDEEDSTQDMIQQL
jgi:hypothetical protein